MSVETTAGLVREAVRRLSGELLEPEEFLLEVAGLVGRAVAFDAAGWMPLDPGSLLPSGALETSKPSELVRALWRADAMGSGDDGLRQVARRRSPVALMRDLAPEVAEASARVGVIKRAGLGEDVRVLFRARGCTWGMGDLYREPGSRPFGARERRLLAALAPAVGEGLRRSLARRPTGALAGELSAPGGVVFNHAGELAGATGEARQLMSLMRGDAAAVLFAVAARAAASDDATARFRLPGGRWLQLRGWRLHGLAGQQPRHMPGLRTAVAITPAAGSELAPLLLRLHGLTAREREVAELLLAGHPTDAIAAQLKISRDTLRDHMHAVFAKVGVTSRAGLMTVATGHATPDIGKTRTERG